MALTFEHRAVGTARRVAVFPGAWNPPTVAHVAIAQAALQWADEVVWVLPRRFPHKTFEGASFETRCEMLGKLTRAYPQFSAAVSETNLHFQIADEAAGSYGTDTEIALVCGRDAVERIATWDYGRADVFEEMLARYPLLVAARLGDYRVPQHQAERIISLHLAGSFDDVSSSEIRHRVAGDLGWQHLVPDGLVRLVAAAYGTSI